MNTRQFADLKKGLTFEIIRPHQIMIEDDQMNDAADGLTFLFRQSTKRRSIERVWSLLPLQFEFVIELRIERLLDDGGLLFLQMREDILRSNVNFDEWITSNTRRPMERLFIRRSRYLRPLESHGLRFLQQRTSNQSMNILQREANLLST